MCWLAALRAFKTRKAEEHLTLGAGWPDTGLAAVNADNSPIRPETYSKAFAAHCVTAAVPVIRLHDVRHTAATMLLDGGTTPSATAKWVGHDPAVTLRVYGHV
jgi:integrase